MSDAASLRELVDLPIKRSNKCLRQRRRRIWQPPTTATMVTPRRRIQQPPMQSPPPILLPHGCNVPWLTGGEPGSMRITGDASLFVAHGEVKKKPNSVRISFHAFITNRMCLSTYASPARHGPLATLLIRPICHSMHAHSLANRNSSHPCTPALNHSRT
jgi:hypothetical protein